MNEQAVPLSSRFSLQQGWWYASELVRRHPHLHIDRGVSKDNDNETALAVFDKLDEAAIVMFFQNHHAVRIGDQVKKLAWGSTLATHDSHKVLKMMEHELGLSIGQQGAPNTTKRSLSYRVIFTILTQQLESRHAWYPLPIDMPDPDSLETSQRPPALEDFDGFPTVVKQYENYVALAILGTAPVGSYMPVLHYRPFWKIMHDVNYDFIIDIEGYAHFRWGQVDLMKLYELFGREVGPIAALLASRSAYAKKLLSVAVESTS